MKMKNFVLSFAILFSCCNCIAEDNDICSKVSEIKTLPFKREHIDDNAYNTLIEKGDESVKCLVEQITNTQLMPDPRQAPPYSGTTVGDIALFVLVDIEDISIEEILPKELKEDFKHSGIYTYFSYVKKTSNRKLIQKNVRKIIRDGEKSMDQ